MASATISSDRFPSGTVTVYPASNWSPHRLPPSGAPVGSSATSASVSGGSVTFSNLSPDTRYYAYQEVGSEHRYVGFSTYDRAPAAQREATELGIWQPRYAGMVGTNFDPATALGAGAPGASLTTTRIWLPRDCTVSNVLLRISTAGTTLTSGQNLCALFSATNGVLLGQTADQSTAWQSTGLKTMAVTAESGQSLSFLAGDSVIVGILSNGTARPQLHRMGGTPTAELTNIGTSAPYYRSGYQASLTAPPNPLTTVTADSGIYWVGLS